MAITAIDCLSSANRQANRTHEPNVLRDASDVCGAEYGLGYSYLRTAEFSMNNAVNRFAGKSPFFLTMGLTPLPPCG